MNKWGVVAMWLGTAVAATVGVAITKEAYCLTVMIIPLFVHLIHLANE